MDLSSVDRTDKNRKLYDSQYCDIANDAYDLLVVRRSTLLF